MDLLINELVAEAEQTVPQPAVILNEIWKTETRNERLGQTLSIALASRETNNTKIENALTALKENTRVLGNTAVRDSLREELTKRLAARTAIDAQINIYQTLLELSISLLWERWGYEIEEFSIAEKGLRLLRGALSSNIDTNFEDDESETNELRGEMRRVMEDIESAVPGLRIFKRVIRRFKKQQNPDQGILRITFEERLNVDANTKCLYNWERIFEEGVESMNEQVVRKWVEDLRPRADGVTEGLATVMEEN